MSALNIKDKDVAEKARRLARIKGVSITAAVSEALDRCLDEATRAKALQAASREREIEEILARIRASIPKDAPTYEQIMEEMYDEDGLPR